MKTTSLLLALSLVCAPLALAAPQQQAPTPQEAAAQDQKSSGPPLVPAEQLQLQYYNARRASAADDLLDALQGLALRKYYVKNADGSITGPVVNVRGFGNTPTLVIYDLPERIEQITTMLADLERATGEGEGDGSEAKELQLVQYSPRSVPIESLFSSLRPFLRTVLTPDGEGVPNITAVTSPAHLVLRDTADNIEQMLDCLKHVDEPAPQFVVKCWLLRGSDRETPKDLPPELIDNLRRLVPFREFEPVSMALLRASLVPGQKQQLRGDFRQGDGDQRFDLELVPGGYDKQGGLLSFERCSFQATTGQQFSTSATVGLGEFVVLGAAGSEPLFVVLRVTPVER